MGEVKHVNFRKSKDIYELDTCSGCSKEITDNEAYTRITLPYEDYKKHIALCEKCYNSAIDHGVVFG